MPLLKSLRAARHTLLLAVLLSLMVACTTSAGVAPTIAPEVEVTEPTTAPAAEAATPATVDEATAAPVAGALPLSFAPATYTDESAGYALDYPADWTVAPESQIGVRGGQALLLSPGTTAETLADDGTRVSLTTYIWDPKNDLDAYVAQRKIAWEASGFAIEREEQWQLADGRAAHAFVVQMPEQPTFTLLTTVGEDYLQLSGDGDVALVEEIARTLRPLD